MGFFDWLFGGGKKEEAPQAKPKKVKVKVSAPEAPAGPAGGLTPEVIAAISASVGIVMEEEEVSAEMVAAVTAAIVHASGGGTAVRFKRATDAWAATGRQKIMDGRQYLTLQPK